MKQFVTVIGHSGFGKTTILFFISGLNQISGGIISVLRKHIKYLGSDRGVIFHAPSLMPWMTSLQNVLLSVIKFFRMRLERNKVILQNTIYRQ